ncbi:hypothetical protein [Chondromyces apiculatus]|nr:hypothetical protein [Chondromyces apiculatus]
MKIIRRADQDRLTTRGSLRKGELSDAVFDGNPLPRELTARNWKSEGSVHRTRVLADNLDSTRYFCGPQVSILRDDNRLVTWAAVAEVMDGAVEQRQLVLCKLSGNRPATPTPPKMERQVIAEGPLFRHHIALDKASGEVSVTWITRSEDKQQIWHNGKAIETEAEMPDFPFFAFSQPPIGHVVADKPAFGLLSYKCRKSGRLFWRRVADGEVGPERELKLGQVLGGLSFSAYKDDVVARADLLVDGKIIPVLLKSTDAGESFGPPSQIDMSSYDAGFEVAPGYTRPVVDIGGNFHAPILASNGKESVALNYLINEGALVEAIRVTGTSPTGSLEVFPATVGHPGAHGDGTTDGFGLIMVLGTEGQLFTSNSSAGGIFFPRSTQLNHEMPLVAAFGATECYGSGLKPNFVSMDYIYIEADARGEPVSATAHLETWDMPLPIPKATAKSDGSRVELSVISDADLEPGKVNFRFSDPSINVLDVKVTGLRTAIVDTDRANLKGTTLIFEVNTIFHRHYGEALVA